MKVSDAKTTSQPRSVLATEGSSDAAKIDAAKAADVASTAKTTAPAAVRQDRVTVAQTTVVEEARRSAVSDRANRLKEVEAAVRQGTYKPDAGRIAERILEDAEITARLRAALL